MQACQGCSPQLCRLLQQRLWPCTLDSEAPAALQVGGGLPPEVASSMLGVLQRLTERAAQGLAWRQEALHTLWASCQSGQAEFLGREKAVGNHGDVVAGLCSRIHVSCTTRSRCRAFA